MSARAATTGRLGLVAVAALAVGCTRPRTEAVIVVQTAGVRIPDDVAALRVQVADHKPGGDDMSINDLVYKQDVVLCHAGLGAGCYDVPVTASLYPGKRQPNDSVRVQIDALARNGDTVISDAALFTFADGQRLRLDFVLYANCLGNQDCALRDQVCGPDDRCVDLKPVPLGNKPDLAPLPPPDLAPPPRDLAGVPPGADLAQSPPDLTPAGDMAGCDTVSCGPGMVCVAGGCVSCGFLGDPCCDTGVCNSSNLRCDGTNCIQCGTPPYLCCAGNVCFGSMCNTGTGFCEPMAPPDMSMMPPDMSMAPPDMSSDDMRKGTSLDLL